MSIAVSFNSIFDVFARFLDFISVILLNWFGYIFCIILLVGLGSVKIVFRLPKFRGRNKEENLPEKELAKILKEAIKPEPAHKEKQISMDKHNELMKRAVNEAFQEGFKEGVNTGE